MTRYVPESARCLGCGYALRGLPDDNCPECGRAFDPADPSTYGKYRFESKWRRWAQAPGIGHIAVMVVLTLLTVDGRSSPLGMPMLPLCCLMVPVWPALVLSFCMRAAATRADRQRAQRDRTARRRRGVWRWVVTPVCVVLASSMWFDNWPLRLRFALSRDAFEQQVRLLRAKRPTGRRVRYDCFVGLYYVEFAVVHRRKGRVFFRVPPEFLGTSGFVYSPEEPYGWDEGLPAGWYVYGN
jgi:rRNA maturation protein Nop10